MDWDIAWSLEPNRRRALVIFYGQMDGNEWDFDKADWKPRASS